MIEECVFMLTIGKIIEENHIQLNWDMSQMGAKVGIQIPLLLNMKLVVPINIIVKNVMVGKNLNTILKSTAQNLVNSNPALKEKLVRIIIIYKRKGILF